jgi:hypothetical protein
MSKNFKATYHHELQFNSKDYLNEIFVSKMDMRRTVHKQDLPVKEKTSVATLATSAQEQV